MSLISDTDFLIHSMRLSYLRDVEDPYGSRLITLAPAYNSNSYIIASSLNDIDRWPELAMPSSPQLSDDERPSGFPGARGLHYTKTIMGGRTGGLGLRVNGKRASTSKRMSMNGTLRGKDFLSGSNIGGKSLSDTREDWVNAPPGADAPTGSAIQVKIQEATVAEEAPVAKVVQFIPKFKGAAEMEARRRVRMAARRGPGAAAPAPPPVLSFSSSSDEEEENADESSDSDFGHTTVDAMDDGDEFDPDFATSHTPGPASDSVSDVASVLSAATNSVPSPQGGALPRPRPRLSPVSEGPVPDRSGTYFEMLTPGPGSARDASPQNPSRKPDIPTRNPARTQTANHGVSSSVSSVATPDMTFARKKVAPLPSRPQRSALTSLLASSNESTNPFAELYAAVSGRGEGASTNVQVYFPMANSPRGRAMDLNVRKDATVEEVIGFALWSYWEEGWLPKLDEGMENADEDRLAIRLSAIGWIMRIAEEDGEVDDDFPPPDRIGKIAKFNADAYAVLEATPAQIQQNQLIESKIQRHPSRLTTAKKQERPTVSAPNLAVASSGSTFPGSGIFGSALGASVPFSTSLGGIHGPQIFLRIKVEDTGDTVHVATTIPVSAGMYMQEVLERVCAKTKLDHPEAYALLLADDDKRILIPLDRTVASLGGKRELVVIRRTLIDDNVIKGTGKTTDPNASILKRMSDTPEVKYPSAMDFSNVYKQYTIYRKMPMLVAKQERTLAFDGLYIHILPTANKATKAVFDSGKHASYHIRSIADCRTSAKSSAIFKLVIGRGSGGKKRYDYEAESAKHANEIVTQIWNLKNSQEHRSGTLKSRRSRHVV
ncbi:stress-activated map kinase interacting protein 1-domain-containing protein [Favolaschia claudopus]|uniref:Stress-activated map kinase interacting protein 1-domain-containing protein n=1 Tax=Favolaschia claudopus TaxID=2862362 RepID=A0AAW0EKY3_9AGAR